MPDLSITEIVRIAKANKTERVESDAGALLVKKAEDIEMADKN